MPHRFAIVGCGHIAPRHAAAIRQVGHLVAVVDSDPLRAENLAAASGGTPFTSAHEMLASAEPDIVVVCTPSGSHPEHVMAALENRCHVLCEKPMAIDSGSARKMIAKAADVNRRLFVVKQNRYNAPVAAAKRLIEAGKLGSIHGFQVNCFWNRPAEYYSKAKWRGTMSLDGGTLFTQFSHFIDLLYWFLGDVREVRGWRANYLHQDIISFEDTGSATLWMKSGAIGNLQYTLNAFDHNMEGSIALFGNKGTIKIGGQYLNRMEHFAVEQETPENWLASSHMVDGHFAVYHHLVKALATPQHRAVEAVEALKSIEMIEMIYKECPMIQ